MNIKNLGSSETTREAPLENFYLTFNFDFYICPKHKKIDPFFLEWFIGFSEGVGSFVIQQKDGKPHFSFQILQQDPKLIHKIRTQLGYGRVSQFSENYWKFCVSDKKGLQRLVSLFSGNLVFAKTRQQFHNWVERGSTLGFWSSDFTSSEYTKRFDRRIRPNLTTGWFAGFVDAEGYFYADIRQSSGSKVIQLIQKFQILRENDCQDYKILDEFSILFENWAQLALAKRKKVYLFEIQSLESHRLLVLYLQKFPLQSKKKIAFLRWWRLSLRRNEKNYLTEKGVQKLKRLCHAINRQTKEEIKLKKGRLMI